MSRRKEKRAARLSVQCPVCGQYISTRNRFPKCSCGASLKIIEGNPHGYYVVVRRKKKKVIHKKVIHKEIW